MPFPPLSATLRAQLELPLDSKDLVVPHFAALYRYLTDEILESHDASSSATNRIHEQTGMEAALREYWFENARNQVLIKALREICMRPGSSNPNCDLSISVRELGLVIAAYLNYSGVTRGEATIANSSMSQPRSVDELMDDEFHDFKAQIPAMARVLGQHISEIDQTVQKMLLLLSEADPEANATRIPSIRTRIPASTTVKQSPLQPHLSSSTLLQTQLDKHKTDLTTTLPNLLTTLTSTLQALLSTHTTNLVTRITHLETHTHSTQSRNLTTQAQFLSTVAKGIHSKAQIQSLLREKEIYAQQGIREALQTRYDELSLEEEKLSRREKDLSRALDEYDRDEVFRTLGFEYTRVEGEIEVVKADIERLEGEIARSKGGATRARMKK